MDWTKEINQLTSEEYCEMMNSQYETEKYYFDKENNVITDISQLDGWKIVGLRRFGAETVEYSAIRFSGNVAEHIIGYAKEEVFLHLQL